MRAVSRLRGIDDLGVLRGNALLYGLPPIDQVVEAIERAVELPDEARLVGGDLGENVALLDHLIERSSENEALVAAQLLVVGRVVGLGEGVWRADEVVHRQDIVVEDAGREACRPQHEGALEGRHAPQPPQQADQALGELLLGGGLRVVFLPYVATKPFVVIAALSRYEHAVGSEAVGQRVAAAACLAVDRARSGAPLGIEAVGADLLVGCLEEILRNLLMASKWIYSQVK